MNRGTTIIENVILLLHPLTISIFFPPPVTTALWPMLQLKKKTTDHAASMFAIVTEMIASVNSASGSSHKTHSIRCLLFTFRSPKLRKNCLSNTDLKPLNAQSLSLLLFSINILSMPMSLEQALPGGDRKIYHQKPEWLLISQCFSFIEEMLPLEASKGLQEKPSLAMVFTRRC